MARLHLLILLLIVVISIVTVSSAADDKPVDKLPSTTTASAPTATTPTSGEDVDVAEAPGDDNTIGTTDDDAAATPGDGDDDVAVAGPIGSDSSYANYPPPQQTTSGSCVTCTIGFAIISAATVGSLFVIL